MKIKNIVGLKFGKLLVLNIATERGNKNQIRYDCICDCGNSHTVSGESIRAGKSKSCGCNKKLYKPKTYNLDRHSQIVKQLYNSTIQKRTKKNNYSKPLTLNEFSILIKEPCFYCGQIPFTEINDRCNDINKDLSVTVLANGIDRIDSNLGYEVNNCVSCCKHCNTAKNSMTIEQFKNWIKKIYEYNFK